MATCKWTGKSGTVYEYEIYDVGATWNEVAGNYIFAKHDGSRVTAIYIGQTDSFKKRLTPSHEKIPCTKKHGATNIHARVVTSEKDRRAEEADLIAGHNPPCNIQGT